ncbi:MAG: hypothetical protein H7145_15150 [Akkermansiaceae bacterium]|nr:hypothetical protein [Armatimonadota bacterium]
MTNRSGSPGLREARNASESVPTRNEPFVLPRNVRREGKKPRRAESRLSPDRVPRIGATKRYAKL